MKLTILPKNYIVTWLFQLTLTLICFWLLNQIHIATENIYFELKLEIVPRIILVFSLLGIFLLYVFKRNKKHSDFHFIITCILSFALACWTYYLFIETSYGLYGASGDAGFHTSLITHYKEYSYLTDNIYKGLSASYPPFYFYVMAKISNLFNIEGYKMLKYSIIAMLLVLPQLTYLVWKYLFNSGNVALVVTMLIFLFIPEFSLYKPFEFLPLLFFVPWWLYYVMNIKDSKNSLTHFISGSIIGGVLFHTYYYWFFAGIVSWVLWLGYFLIKGGIKEGISNIFRHTRVLLGTAVCSSVYFIPLIIDFITIDIKSYANMYLTFAEEKIFYADYMRITLFGIFCTIGGATLLFTIKLNRISKVVSTLLVSVFIWYMMGYVGILLEKPNLHIKMIPFIDYLLVIGFGVCIWYVFKYIQEKYGLKDRKLIVTAVIPLFLFGGEKFLDIRNHFLYKKAYKVQEAYITNTQLHEKLNNLNNAVILSNSWSLNVYYPVYRFISPVAHYSHPSGRFSERIEFLKDMKKLPPEDLSWFLQYNPFNKIDYLFFEGGHFNITINDDNFPIDGYKKETILFNSEMFNDNSLFFREDFNGANQSFCLIKIKDTEVNQFKNLSYQGLKLLRKHNSYYAKFIDTKLVENLLVNTRNEKPLFNSSDKKQDIIKESVTVSELLNLSIQYYNEQKFKECIYSCIKVIEIDPDNVVAYNNICSAFNELNDFSRAEQACRKALEINPDFELAKNNLNVALKGGN